MRPPPVPGPTSLLLVLAALGGVLLDADPARAQEDPRTAMRDAVSAWTTPPPGAAPSQAPVAGGPRLERWGQAEGLGLETRAALLRQYAADMDGGGSLAVTRLFTRLGLRVRPASGPPFAVSLGYRLDRYDFSGRSAGPLAGRPWQDIHGPSLGVPVFVPLPPRWFVVGGFGVRSHVEDGAALEDGLTVGGFLGASYQVSDTLRIGPGFGLRTQIEDDLSFFPVVVVDWQLRPGLSIRTGQGLGATQGPGVFLTWEPSRPWAFSLGGRFDRLRFRLDERGVAPGGVGEESAFGAILAARYRPSERVEWHATVGVSLLGEVRLEDERGRLLQRTDYDPAPIVGLGFTFSW